MSKITKDDLKKLTESHIESRTHTTVVRASVAVCTAATKLVPTSKCASVVKPCPK
jgi:hypothetical protein